MTGAAKVARGLRRRLWIPLLAACLAAGSCAGIVGTRGLTMNDVTTGRTPEYPEVTARVYAAPPQEIYEAARGACGRVARMRITHEDAAALRIEAERATRSIGWIDDVSLWIESAGAAPDVAPTDGNGREGKPGITESRVMIRSRSRVGRGDFGQNARTIRAIQAEMDRAFKRN